jgi:signal transduction histidine kinase/GAF domain-containing protein
VESLARPAYLTDLKTLSTTVGDELSALALSVDEMGEFYSGMERILSSALPFERLSLAIMSPSEQSFTHVYTSGEPIGGWRVGDVVRRSESDVWRAMDLRVPSVQAVEAANGRYRSLLSIPIMASGKIVAGLNLRHGEEAAYGEYDLQLARAIAESLSAPMSYLPLPVGLMKRAAHADVIAEISRLVSSVSHIGDVYSQFADMVGELVEFDRLSISSVDRETGLLEVLYVEGVDLPRRGIGSAHRIQGTLVGSAIESGHVAAIDGNSIRANWPGSDDLVASGLQSILAAPLMLEGVLVGSMLMAKKNPAGYVAEDLAIAGRIASQISGLVSAELRRKELDRDAKEKEALADLARKASSSLDIRDVYGSVSSNLALLIPHDSFVIMSVDMSKRTTICDYSGDAFEDSGRGLLIEEPEFWEAMQQGRPSSCRGKNVLKHIISTGYFAGIADRDKYSTLAIPLRQHGESVAALIVQTSVADAYDERTISLAANVGSRLEGAIANAAVHRRSIELAQEQAVRLEVEAENLELIGAAQARSEFLSNVSHELRTPLTTVSSLTSSLARTVKVTGSDRERVILDWVRGATGRLKEVVDSLLDISALESGRGSLKIAPLDIQPVLLEVVNRFNETAGERLIQIEADITDAPLRICGDPIRLDQAISNVLDNAVRYSTKGTPVLLSAGIEDDAVSISIANAASCLSDTEVIQIMRPFYRIDNLATRSEPGVGVGLTISKAILELHEGSLLVEPLPDGGMRANMAIPLRIG